MSRRHSSALSVAVVLLCAAIVFPFPAAGIGFQPVNPDELKMTSDPQAPGAAAIILFHEIDRDDNSHTSHEDVYFRKKIFTEEGRKYGDVEIVFARGLENIVNVHGRSIQPDGTIAEFNGKVIDKIVEKSRGLKVAVKTFTIPNVQPGCVIEYYYTNDLKEMSLFESHWILSDELFTKNAKFSLKPYKNQNGNNFHVRWIWQGLPAGSLPKQGPDTVVRMEASNIPAFPSEDYMPPENELKARVDFIYSDEDYEKDADKFWKKDGKKRNGRLEGFVGKPGDVAGVVAQTVNPNDSPDVKLRKLYDRVLQIRNTSYEVRKTTQEEKRENEKEASNAAEILRNGYGEGQDLTWVYLALVKAAGLDAYGCWVSDRSNYFFNKNTMQREKLDANVVLVKLNGKDLYFDPGAKFIPFGSLPWPESGVVGIKLDKDGGTWIETPLGQPSESQILRSAKLKLTDTGDLEGKLTITYTGLEAASPRLEERNTDEVDRKKFLEDGVKEQIPAAAEIELTNKPDWDGTETPFVAEFDLKIPGWASNAGKRALLPVGFFSAREKRIFEHTERVHPVYFRYPYEKDDDVNIQLPAGWKVASKPQPQDQDGHIVHYVLKVEAADDASGTVHVTRKLDVNFLMLPQKYYLPLRSFFQIVRTGDEEQVVLQPGVASASN